MVYTCLYHLFIVIWVMVYCSNHITNYFGCIVLVLCCLLKIPMVSHDFPRVLSSFFRGNGGPIPHP